MYGPVRYTIPGRKNGSEPAPLAIRTVPTWEFDGHVPAFASASEHSGTPAGRASRPGGRVTDRPESP